MHGQAHLCQALQRQCGDTNRQPVINVASNSLDLHFKVDHSVIPGQGMMPPPSSVLDLQAHEAAKRSLESTTDDPTLSLVHPCTCRTPTRLSSRAAAVGAPLRRLHFLAVRRTTLQEAQGEEGPADRCASNTTDTPSVFRSYSRRRRAGRSTQRCTETLASGSPARTLHCTALGILLDLRVPEHGDATPPS